jgi:hypothetical protein
MIEEWRTVHDAPNYQVSNLGRVRGPRRMLKPSIHDGYARVILYPTKGTRLLRRVHTLVLEAFVSPRPEGLVGRHLNGIGTDNIVSNLVWGTQSENEQDKVGHGTSNRAEGAGRAKLTWDMVREIRTKHNPKVRGLGCKRLAKEYDVAASTIKAIVTNRTWIEE